MRKKFPLFNSSKENNTIKSFKATSTDNSMIIQSGSKASLYARNSSIKSKNKTITNLKVNNEKKKEKNKSIPKKGNYYQANNLLPKYYKKPLKYAFNYYIHAVNTQFDNYNRNSSTKKMKTCKLFNRNNKTNFNPYSFKNNSNHHLINGKIQMDKNIKYRNLINLGRNSYNNYCSTYLSKEDINEINQKIIKIQSNYRYHFSRNKLYNTFLIYGKITKFLKF